MRQNEKLMFFIFQKMIEAISFYAFFFLVKKTINFIFQIGKDFAYLAVTMVLERQSERDCGYAAA